MSDPVSYLEPKLFGQTQQISTNRPTDATQSAVEIKDFVMCGENRV